MLHVVATWMHGRSSKRWFLDRRHLAEVNVIGRSEIAALVAAAFGLADDGRQIDGVGGAATPTPNAAVIWPADDPTIDVEYDFALSGDRADLGGRAGAAAAALPDSVPGSGDVTWNISRTTRRCASASRQEYSRSPSTPVRPAGYRGWG